MIELPEAHVLARQLEATVRGMTVASVVAGQSPHRFAFFTGDPDAYGGLLTGLTVTDAVAYGAWSSSVSGSSGCCSATE